MDNCVQVTKTILNLFKVKHTTQYVEDFILSHTHHPSLLSISDILNSYNIANLPIKIGVSKLEEMSMPLITQTFVSGQNLFYVLKEFSENKVVYIDDRNNSILVRKEEFLKIWTGVCLLINPSRISKEPYIESRLAKRRIVNLLTVFLLVFLIMWVGVSFFQSEIISNTSAVSWIAVIVFFILKLVGMGSGIMTLLHDLEKYKPKIERFCSDGIKINCDFILNSKHAKLFNGNLSLGLLGFSYFFSSFWYAVILGFTEASISLLSILSFITLPVIIMSVYYQAVVFKQWCKICLITLGALVSEIVAVSFGEFYKSTIRAETIPLVVVLFLIPIVAWKILKPLLEIKKQTRRYKRALKKIKNNPYVLEGLLARTKKITTISEGLGICIHKTTAKYNVIKVCNPYCGPSAKAHHVLEELVNAGKINLQIIFTATNMSNDYRLMPVKHFLALEYTKNKNKILGALSDWYRTEERDYNSFAQRHPLNGELRLQSHKIDAMSKWCYAENILYTPSH